MLDQTRQDKTMSKNDKPRIAVLDDSQRVSSRSADWAGLSERAEITVFEAPFPDEDSVVSALAPFDVMIPMRERTPFPERVLARLPRLKLIALTGARAPTLDVAACTRLGILVCNTGGTASTAATAELAFGLILACARRIPEADQAMRAGGWHAGVGLGFALAGRRLGIMGLGRLGSRVAAYGKAFGMECVAWSQNLTAERAQEHGVTLVSRDELLATSDVVSLHLVLSERTRHLIGKPEIALMRQGAVLVNTSRGPIIETEALLDAVTSGRIIAGLDVFDQEPLAADHPLRKAPNIVLTPHLGYGTAEVFREFYGESVENIIAWLDGKPIRMVNPDALRQKSL
jgi:phosphoglycerate dehydrogenase-like enzyme